MGIIRPIFWSRLGELNDAQIIEYVDSLRKSHAKKKKEFLEIALYSDGAISIDELMKMPASYRQFIYPILEKIASRNNGTKIR